jgi:DNA-binding response OmpR family regulator
MALTVVLSVGLDPGLLRARNLVLQSAGYIVVSAHSVTEAVDQFQTSDFDLVLLCQTIPTRDRDGLTWWMRAFRPGTPVVSVAGNLCAGDVVAGVTIGSDPAALLWGMREVLVNSKNLTARTAATLGKQEGEAARMKKPPRLRVSYKGQTRVTREHFAPFSRTG